MSKIVLKLTGDISKRAACNRIMSAPDGHVVTIAEPVKKREQEEKYHAMIGDIAKQCTFMGRKWSREEWKRLLIDAYVRVARENATAEGKPDPFQGQGEIVPAIDGSGFVQLGVQSRCFKVRQASEFIEYLRDYGENQLVVWSEEFAPERCAA